MGLALVAALVLAASWRYATAILRPAPGQAVADVMVVDVGEDTLTLDRSADSARPGVWGLDWPGGYARMAEIVDAETATVTRRLLRVAGAPEAGQRLLVDAHAYPSDPDEAFFFPTEGVRLDSANGAVDADLVVPAVTAPDQERTRWRTAGPRDTWAVVVPDPAAARSQAYRVVPVLRQLGLPTLVAGPSPGGQAGPGGAPALGGADRRHVRAAVDHAVASGARDVVLVGFGMGGAMVSGYLHDTDAGDRVAGVVLDAPVLDWRAAAASAAAERGVPRWLAPIARALARARAGLRPGRLDQLARAGELDTPILLFHGTADRAVPVASSDAFAAARPDLVTYERAPGAGHAQAWNRDPGAYEDRLRDFLTGVLD